MLRDACVSDAAPTQNLLSTYFATALDKRAQAMPAGSCCVNTWADMYMSRSADQGLCTDTVPGFPASFNNRSAASRQILCSRPAAASQRSERPERNRTEREKTHTRTLHGGAQRGACHRTLHGGAQHGACHRFGQAGAGQKGPRGVQMQSYVDYLKFRPGVKYAMGQRVLYILAIYICVVYHHYC